MDLGLKTRIAVVTGASKGIGLAITRTLAAEGAIVVADMITRGEGTIVNVAKSLSQELGPPGIRITSVSPEPVATDLWLGEHGVAETVGRANGAGAGAAAVRDQMAAGMAAGRFTSPEEVAAIVAVLCSPRVANVTGANWAIDGGLIKSI